MAPMKDVIVRIEWPRDKGAYAQVEGLHCLNMNDYLCSIFHGKWLGERVENAF